MITEQISKFVEERTQIVLPSGCHIWMRQTDKDGYALGNIKTDGRYKTLRLSRLICEAAHGPSFGRMACHSCDTPSCLNPNHLFWGEAFVNNRDRSDKGRTSKHAAKLTPSQVDEIRLRYSTRVRGKTDTATKLAAEFGVHRNTILNIAAGVRWAK